MVDADDEALAEVLGRQCRYCGRWLPAPSFHRHKTSLYGLRADCKSCRRERRQLRKLGVIQNRRRLTLNAVGRLLERGQLKRDSAEFYTALVEAAGGVWGIADLIVRHAEAAPAGDKLSVRLLSAAVDVIAQAEACRQPEDFEALTDEELKAELRRALGELEGPRSAQIPPGCAVGPRE